MKRIAILLLAASATACTASPEPAVPGPTSLSPSPSPEPRAPFAVWPEDTPDEAAAAAERLASGEDAWREDPGQTAVRFVRTVLGWPEAQVEDVSEQLYSTFVEVRRESGGPSLTIQVDLKVADRFWTVTSVQGELPEPVPIMTVTRTEASMSVNLRHADRAELVVVYGDRETSATIEESGPVSVEIPPHETPGHLMLLFFDDDGEVISALATPVGVNGFAAG